MKTLDIRQTKDFNENVLQGFVAKLRKLHANCENARIRLMVFRETGGFYIPSGSDMTALIEDIQSREAGEIGEQVITRPIERFILFVGLAIVALSLEILLPETKREDD